MNLPRIKNFRLSAYPSNSSIQCLWCRHTKTSSVVAEAMGDSSVNKIQTRKGLLKFLKQRFLKRKKKLIKEIGYYNKKVCDLCKEQDDIEAALDNELKDV